MGVERGLENIHCPKCSAGLRMLVVQADGSIKCLQCDAVFWINGWVPKLSVKDRRPAKYLGGTRSFIDLMRPFSLIAAGLAGFFLVLLFSAYQGLPFNFLLALGCGASLAFLQSAGQSFNQSLKEEIAIDKVSGKIYRPVVQGLITPMEGKLFSCILFVLGISFAFGLSVGFGLFSILVAFFAIFYTAEPIRAKKRFLINNFWQGIARGCLPVLAVGYGLFGAVDMFPIFLGVVIAVWIMGGQPTKDFGGDEKGDLKFGIRTLPVVLGRKRAIDVMAGFVGASFILLLTLISFELLPLQFLLLLVLAVPSYFMLSNLNTFREVRLLENNLSWGVYYGTLGLWFILPSIVLL